MDAMQIGPEHRGLFLYLAAQAASEADNGDLAARHLEAALASASELGPELRTKAATIADRAGRLDLVAAFLDDTPPTLALLDFSYGAEDLRRASQHIIAHSTLTALLGRPFAAGAAPGSQLLATYQTRLETLARLYGEGRGGRPPSVEPLKAFRTTLDFLQHAEGDSPHDSERWRLDEVMDEAVAAMVDAAAALAPETLARFTEAMDARLAVRPGRLGRSSVRRAYAMAAFRHEHDVGRAELRIAYVPGLEGSPAEQLAEAAQAASAFSAFGLWERARETITQMHEDGVGYSRPARKDAQYVLWRDLFARACDEDPAGRQDRLRFFGRLLSGLAKTEGDNAGRRLAPAFLDQAAQAGPAWASAAAERMDEIGLASWPDVVAGILSGLVKQRPELIASAGVVFGRVALPFATEHDGSIYPALIRAAPVNQLETVVRHALTCIETDAHPARRITFLEEVVEAAADRGLARGTDALARWRSELPPPRSGSSPEDPFFLVRSVEELGDMLQLGGDTDSGWGAVRALERLAPRADYDALKEVFDFFGTLKTDVRAIDAMAHAAMAAGRQADAESHLVTLKEAAEDGGAWGSGWIKNSKLRYHRLNVQLRGETARQTVFRSFVNDLAQRRESIEHILPDLGDILELLSPWLPWGEAWASLQQHLSEFREHRLGEELDAPTWPADGQEHILADILFRAVDTTASALGDMARTAAIELSRTAGGHAILAALLPRFWQAGGYHALQASQIAWECRDVPDVRDAVLPLLAEMIESEDYAVRRTAVFLAHDCGQQVGARRSELPFTYHVELPPNPYAGRFEPPTGLSSVSLGLSTEDAYSWTWPLKEALRITTRATGLNLANLRVRAAQLMNRNDGTARFGPDAVERQQRRLKRLGLHLRHRRLPVMAAFQAMREVLGELVAAEAIDPSAIPFILLEADAFARAVATVPPVPRPHSVPLAELPYPLGAETSAEWRLNAKQDAIKPAMHGFLVLAATAVHRRQHFRDEWLVEQYLGPAFNPAENGLGSQLAHLPMVVIANSVAPLYEGAAPGAVVCPITSSSVALNAITLCPRVAAAVGWHPNPRHVFDYLDHNGQVAATTCFWRDGGELTKAADSGVARHGYILMVREDCTEKIRPHTAPVQVSRAWRITQKHDGHNREIYCGDRDELRE